MACSVWNVRRRPHRDRLKSGMASRSSPKAEMLPSNGLTKPLSTLKNVVLPAPFGPISPQVAASKVNVIPSIGMTPPKRTVSCSTTITRPAPRPSRASPARLPRRAAGLLPLRSGAISFRPRRAMSRGNCSTIPPGRGQQDLQDADAEQDRQDLGRHAPVVEQRGQQAEEERGDDGAGQVVDAAHEDDGEERDRVRDRELVDADPAGRGGQQRAGDTGEERGQRERPQLVEGGVDARRDRAALALAHRRPGSPRLAPHVPRGDDEHERRHHHAVAVVRDVALGDGRPGEQRGRAAGRGVAEEPASAVGELCRL